MGGKIFAEDLQERRKAHGMSAGQLAEMLDISPVHMSRLETGASSITARVILRCVQILGALTLVQDGLRYTVTPEQSHASQHDDTACTRDLDLGTSAIRAGNEAGEAISAITHLPDAISLYERDPAAGRAALVALTRDAICDPVRAFRAFEAALRGAVDEAGVVLAEAWAAEGYYRAGGDGVAA